MVRDWVAIGCGLLTMPGCGSRTELLLEYETGESTLLDMRCELEGDDPRVAGIAPDEVATLDAKQFVSGDARYFHWTVEAEDCDAVVPNAQYTLVGERERVLRFRPSRPATYHFTLEAKDASGRSASCKLNVPVKGVGMRVELCWDTNRLTDIDLYLHTAADRAPWFSVGADSVSVGLNNTTCNNLNCIPSATAPNRVDWGYADSPLDACQSPPFKAYVAGGRCPNPRGSADNNQTDSTGTTERMQLDNPRPGETGEVSCSATSVMPNAITNDDSSY